MPTLPWYGFMLIFLYFADATAYENAHFGPDANIIIGLDDVACTTAQSRVIDCTHDSNTGDCSHSDDAGGIHRNSFLRWYVSGDGMPGGGS